MQVFTPFGILSGAFFVASMANTIFAIKYLGLSTAAGLWSGTAGKASSSKFPAFTEFLTFYPINPPSAWASRLCRTHWFCAVLASFMAIVLCCAVVVSFTFGVKVVGDSIQKPGLAAPGLMLLIGGIAGIALNGEVVARRHKNEGAFHFLQGRIKAPSIN